jgi:hypothetical protein
MMGTLKREEISNLCEVAQTAGIASSRDALLSGLSTWVIAGMKTDATPAAQLLLDLTDLNERDEGTAIAIWLANAVRLSGGRKEATTFQEALDGLWSRLPDPSGLGDPRHGPTRIYVTSDLLALTLPVQVDLAAPAGVVLDRIIEARRLPRSVHYEDRIGLRLKYWLSARHRILERAEPLDAYGVRAGDVLSLVTKSEPFAGADPIQGALHDVTFRKAGGLAGDERERELIRDAFERAGLIGDRAAKRRS